MTSRLNPAVIAAEKDSYSTETACDNTNCHVIITWLLGNQSVLFVTLVSLSEPGITLL